MMSVKNHALQAGQLIQCGLRPRLSPAQDERYRELLTQFHDEAEFRDVVKDVAEGLGLMVLDSGEHGVVFGPLEGSVFHLKPADFRSNSSTVDDRLLDGLVQLAIAATVFPRAADLDEDSLIARKPVAVEEVDDLLRSLCERLKSEAKGDSDPSVEDEAAGLAEAWRVYFHRAQTSPANNGRISRSSIRGTIQFNLDRLKELGCFSRHESRSRVEWQPLWRYQVQVKELAATTTFQYVRELLLVDATKALTTSHDGDSVRRIER